eukprot:m.75323 g.75323  ORF g.75323 m.75323 type:complete len:62 (-) comp24769_c0_seq2:226-411(-)
MYIIVSIVTNQQRFVQLHDGVTGVQNSMISANSSTSSFTSFLQNILCRDFIKLVECQVYMW